jgi:cardiolipin synthase A/B
MNAGRWLKGAGAAVLLTFAWIGVLHSVRTTPLRRVDPAGGTDLPRVDDPEFERAVELLTSASLEPGCSVRLLRDGHQTFPALWDDLRAATETIDAQIYYIAPGEIADRFAQILAERAAAGVRVRLVYDWFGGVYMPGRYFSRLRAAGVEVAALRPLHIGRLHELQHRSHVRLVVVDRRVAYTGGFGADDQWKEGGDSDDAWRDTNVRFTGPAVLQASAVFAGAWAEAAGTLRAAAEEYRSPSTEPGDAKAGVLFTSPNYGSTAPERLFTLTFACARERLWISNSYFVPTPFLTDLLADAARRGVDVRLLVPDSGSDVKAVYWGGRTRYPVLLDAGVRIFEYTAEMMHAKTFVMDGAWSTVGGLNLDNRSLALLDEATLLVLDRAFAAEMEELFEADLRNAREVRPEEFRRRPLWARAVERAAGATWRLL